MKRFEFPLDRVARWTQQKLSVEQLALVRLIKELSDLDQRLQDLRRQVTDGQSRLQSQPVLTGYELQTLARFIHKIGQERERLQPIRARMLQRIAAQRQRVIAEHRRVRLFENLKDRRKSEWLQELSKEEDALASDLFLAKLARELRETQVSHAGVQAGA